ncbi:MAG: CHAP domain-containing protein [Rhodopila sp.]|nr:CHAP domain-containing protein [Rhodopila sp.]
MRRIAFRLLPLLCLILAACGSNRGGARPGDYVGGTAAVECAPFARALTGVSLSGAAADWWWQAAGHYTRTQKPEVGSVLVFRRSGRLPYGHVAVVSQVLSRRQIMVTQANWVHHRVTEDQPVIDTSEDGDWSAVRVWWPPSGQMGGSEYGTFGFIRPDHPAGHDRLIATTPSAIRIAENGW